MHPYCHQLCPQFSDSGDPNLSSWFSFFFFVIDEELLVTVDPVHLWIGNIVDGVH